MKKAFTLIELVVAIGILAVMLGFGGVIFNVSIDAYRTGGAHSEIMQKLRAITDQLNTDFAGLQKDAPFLIWFDQRPAVNPANPMQRFDQIMFFASGDFQSTRLYRPETGYNTRVPDVMGAPIRGNVARIFYGQAQSRDSRDNNVKYPYYLLDSDRVLARRRHILTADPYLVRWPYAANITILQTSFEELIQGVFKNDTYEHDSLPLSLWKTLDNTAYGAGGGTIMNTCFDNRPLIDIANLPSTIHNLMCEGVGSFAVQWAYRDPLTLQLRWFPSEDPDGDGFNTDSHFILMSGLPITPEPAYADFDAFGAIFNIPNTTQINYWGSASLMRYDPIGNFPADFYPRALKFTFTIYDSKGILEKGKTFTHIVYLE